MKKILLTILTVTLFSTSIFSQCNTKKNITYFLSKHGDLNSWNKVLIMPNGCENIILKRIRYSPSKTNSYSGLKETDSFFLVFDILVGGNKTEVFAYSKDDQKVDIFGGWYSHPSNFNQQLIDNKEWFTREDGQYKLILEKQNLACECIKKYADTE